jgi:hypothetical protein
LRLPERNDVVPELPRGRHGLCGLLLPGLSGQHDPQLYLQRRDVVYADLLGRRTELVGLRLQRVSGGSLAVLYVHQWHPGFSKLFDGRQGVGDLRPLSDLLAEEHPGV